MLLSWSRAFHQSVHDFPQSVLEIRRFLFDQQEAAIFGCLSFIVSDLSPSHVSLEAKKQLIQKLIFEWHRYIPVVDQLLGRIDGRYIMDRFGLKPGKHLGSILKKAHEAIYTEQVMSLKEVDEMISRFCIE